MHPAVLFCVGINCLVVFQDIFFAFYSSFTTFNILLKFDLSALLKNFYHKHERQKNTSSN